MKKHIYIVVPSYNEEENVGAVYAEIKKNVVEGYVYTFLFVDDGSQDSTLAEIEKLAVKDKGVKFISFSRNFGHQAALKAGIDFTDGDAVISLDCDLQHPASLIPEMIKLWQEGYEVVYTIRKNAHTPFLKNILSSVFYKILNIFSDVNVVEGSADFRLLDRKIIKYIKELNDSSMFLRGLIMWLGFKQIAIPYVPNKRIKGQSKYSFRKMVHLAIDGITSFSVKPLRISTFLGFGISSLAAFYAFYALIAHYLNYKTITGWTSLILATLFFGGIQLIMLGIIGEYVGKIFIESKNRPLYIINKMKL